MHFTAIALLATTALAASIPQSGILTGRQLGSLLDGLSDVEDSVGELPEDLGLDYPQSLETGAECAASDQCQSWQCVAGVCSEITGTPCQTTADCKDGQQYFCSPDKTCLKLGATGEGDACFINEQCGWKRCLNGLCKKPDGEYGAPCSSNSECLHEYVCYQGQFSNRKECLPNNGSEGAPCSNDQQCGGGVVKCISGACTIPECKRELASCDSVDECCSRKCNKTFGVGGFCD